MEKQRIIDLTVDEFEDLISTTVERAIVASQPASDTVPLYSRQDIMRQFKVSYPTAMRYEKMGLLKGRKIGHKVFFSQDELDNLLANIRKPPACNIS